ncbi:hypothetical protein SORBI_3005G174800 [Sorghum bicolor]|uniref:Knottin scorpion toxin-like domain-containing protein n=1 Tax=Sorghum bicolor TaxID=4558 RepID=A0A1B6PT51_SORBI|nr:hypothetical protein SORBI_3005G174800 [Sorghum bicolor]
MRTEYAAICIVLVIMPSTLSSSYIPIEAFIHLPGCTPEHCQTKCLEFANKNGGKVVKSSHCATANCCNCKLAPKQHQPHTTEVKGLADAEDDNGTFVS